jgi:hypothetical protein
MMGIAALFAALNTLYNAATRVREMRRCVPWDSMAGP